MERGQLSLHHCFRFSTLCFLFKGMGDVHFLFLCSHRPYHWLSAEEGEQLHEGRNK